MITAEDQLLRCAVWELIRHCQSIFLRHARFTIRSVTALHRLCGYRWSKKDWRVWCLLGAYITLCTLEFLLMNQAGQGVPVPVRVASLDKTSMGTT